MMKKKKKKKKLNVGERIFKSWMGLHEEYDEDQTDREREREREMEFDPSKGQEERWKAKK